MVQLLLSNTDKAVLHSLAFMQAIEHGYGYIKASYEFLEGNPDMTLAEYEARVQGLQDKGAFKSVAKTGRYRLADQWATFAQYL